MVPILLLLAMSNEIACRPGALSASELRQQAETLVQLRTAVVRYEEQADGYLLHLDAGKISLATLAGFIERESKCCRFLRFRLEYDASGGGLRLGLSGPPGAKEVIRGAFGRKP